MPSMQTQARLFFYAEMIGAGMYHAMARQYRGQPRASKLLKKAGDHEARHGRLFREFYRTQFGPTLMGEGLCRLQGRISAMLIRVVPLKAKIRVMSRIEGLAVENLQKTLAEGPETPLHAVLKDILPDEKFHAALYRALYEKKPCEEAV